MAPHYSSQDKIAREITVLNLQLYYFSTIKFQHSPTIIGTFIIQFYPMIPTTVFFVKTCILQHQTVYMCSVFAHRPPYNCVYTCSAGSALHWFCLFFFKWYMFTLNYLTVAVESSAVCSLHFKFCRLTTREVHFGNFANMWDYIHSSVTYWMNISIILHAGM